MTKPPKLKFLRAVGFTLVVALATGGATAALAGEQTQASADVQPQGLWASFVALFARDETTISAPTDESLESQSMASSPYPHLTRPQDPTQG